MKKLSLLIFLSVLFMASSVAQRTSQEGDSNSVSNQEITLEQMEKAKEEIATFKANYTKDRKTTDAEWKAYHANQKLVKAYDAQVANQAEGRLEARQPSSKSKLKPVPSAAKNAPTRVVPKSEIPSQKERKNVVWKFKISE